LEYVPVHSARKTNLDKNIFTAFSNIYASRFNIIGVDEHEKPFFFRNNRTMNKVKQNYFKGCFSGKPSNNVKKIYFIPMEPERLDVLFDEMNCDMYND
jgi:hypothetical protein